jgi:hypothetical protein
MIQFALLLSLQSRSCGATDWQAVHYGGGHSKSALWGHSFSLNNLYFVLVLLLLLLFLPRSSPSGHAVLLLVYMGGKPSPGQKTPRLAQSYTPVSSAADSNRTGITLEW